MKTNITLFQYIGERNRMTKTLENGINIVGDFNTEYNLINPTIKLAAFEKLDYNYCYIPDSGRYYFIDRVIERRTGFFECYLTEDVLQTYHDEILTLYGTVTQSQSQNYLLSNTPEQIAKPTIDKYTFDNSGFNSDGFYILATTGVNQ